jgi:hypothetical protein
MAKLPTPPAPPDEDALPARDVQFIAQRLKRGESGKGNGGGVRKVEARGYHGRMVLLDDRELGERAHSVLVDACKHPVADAKTLHFVATRHYLARQLVAEHHRQPIGLNKPQSYVARARLEVHRVQACGTNPDEQLPRAGLGRRDLHQRRAFGAAVTSENVCKHGSFHSWTAIPIAFK